MRFLLGVFVLSVLFAHCCIHASVLAHDTSSDSSLASKAVADLSATNVVNERNKIIDQSSINPDDDFPSFKGILDRPSIDQSSINPSSPITDQSSLFQFPESRFPFHFPFSSSLLSVPIDRITPGTTQSTLWTASDADLLARKTTGDDQRSSDSVRVMSHGLGMGEGPNKAKLLGLTSEDMTTREVEQWEGRTQNRERMSRMVMSKLETGVMLEEVKNEQDEGVGIRADVRMLSDTAAATVLKQDEAEAFSLLAGTAQFTCAVSEGDVTILFTPISGGPSIFVSNIKAPDPTDSSTYLPTFGTNMRSLVVTASGPLLYIAVASPGFTNFSIVVTTFGKAVKVLNGYPQFGSNDINHFVVPIAGKCNVQFALSGFTSYSRIYVSASSLPNSTFWTWASVVSFSGVASLTISWNDSHWRSNDASLYVFVQSYVRKSTFMLTTSWSSGQNDAAAIILGDGSPYVNSYLANGQDQFFIYNIATVGCNLTFTVTPLAGDPDLYVSQIISTPNAKSCYKQKCSVSNAYGIEVVSFANAAIGSYYVGVHAFKAASFSLVASLYCPGVINTQSLSSGIPQVGTVQRDQFVYYTFTSFNPNVDISLSLTSRSGDPDIYVTTDGLFPTLSHFQFLADNRGSDLLTLLHTDPHFCKSMNCTFIVGIYAFNNPAEFTLVMTSANGSLRLSDGTSFHGSIARHGYQYFEYAITQVDVDITVTVTAIGRGDPDLYISTTEPHPTALNSIWSASAYMADSITIAHTDKRLFLGNHLYISVFAFSACSFTIVATSEHDAVLQNGFPLSGSVAKGATKFYEINVVVGHFALLVSLTSRNGFVSLYLSTFAHPDRTNASTYDYFVPWFIGSKTISIPYLDALVLPKPNPDGTNTFHIAIVGVSDTNYTVIAATSNATIRLQSGVAVMQHVERGHWLYFSIEVTNLNQSLAIITTPIFGDPDTYVSKSNSHPNFNSYDKKSDTFGGDYLVFSPPNVTVSTYYIGVFAFFNSSFTIVAFVNDPDADPDENVIWLNNGSPQVGFHIPAHFQLFAFVMSSISSRLTITVQSIHGDPDLYVSANKLPLDPHTGHDQATWRSYHIGSDTLTINDAQPAIYYIGVKAFLSDAAWSITASTNGTIEMLREGVPVQWSIAARQYAYYYFTLDRRNYDVTISVTRLTGDPDLYVSTRSARPNTTVYDWKSMKINDDTITISTSDPLYCVNCRYYIGVYAFSATSFVITASFSDVIQLQDGLPQTGKVLRGQMQYYSFPVYKYHDDITFTVIPRSGNPNLYIRSGFKPLLTNYTWHSSNWYSGENFVITPSDSNYCANQNGVCMYYIGVYGQSASNFSIVVTTSASVIKVQESIPIRDWIATGKYEYFVFLFNRVAAKDSYISFIVTALSGDPDIFVSSTVLLPNATTHNTTFSTLIGSDVVIVKNPLPVSYHIGIRSFKNCTFTLLVQYHDPAIDTDVITTLINGVPQTGTVAVGHFSYYRISLDTLYSDLTISLVRRWGNPDLYASSTGIPTLTPSTYQWSSTANGRDLITIRPAVGGDYIIGVYGASAYGSLFSIVVSTSRSNVTLLDGVPYRNDLTQMQYAYFLFNVDSPSLGDLRYRHADAMHHYDQEKSEKITYTCLLALDNHDHYLGGAIFCVSLHEVGLNPDARFAYLDDLFVDEAFRRRGIGTLLLRIALDEAWKQGAEYAYWVTSWENTEAVALYRSLGCAMHPYPNSFDTPDLGGAYDIYVQNPQRNRLSQVHDTGQAFIKRGCAENAEILDNLDHLRRSYRPADHGAPDSVELLREDRER